MPQIKLKKGDTVKILAGKDKNKTGKIAAVAYKTGKITVEGINLTTRFQRPKKSGQKGQRVQLPMPMPPSKMMLVCPNCGKLTRISYQNSPDGSKMRKCKHCGKMFN